ncbi:hypothetical protein F4803DRAFT_506730 [Xylaria telfairii]|nr:hypothetical protein F4803DRAFT_506730 [Xylaria telfairii]
MASWFFGLTRNAESNIHLVLFLVAASLSEGKMRAFMKAIVFRRPGSPCEGLSPGDSPTLFKKAKTGNCRCLQQPQVADPTPMRRSYQDNQKGHEKNSARAAPVAFVFCR